MFQKPHHQHPQGSEHGVELFSEAERFHEKEEDDEDASSDGSGKSNTHVCSGPKVKMEFNYLNVQSSIPLDGECCSFLCEQFLHHVLFIRQQIPCLFPILESKVNNIYQNKEERKRISSKDKKLVKIYEVITGIIDNIISILQQDPENNIFAFVLGNAMTNPKEVYIIKFNNSATCHMNYSDPKKHVHMVNLSKKVIRNIIGGCFDIFMSDCKPLPLYFLARLNSNFGKENENSDEMNEREYSPNHASYISKPNFKFGLKVPSNFRKSFRQHKKEGIQTIDMKVSKLFILELGDHEMNSMEISQSKQQIANFLKFNMTFQTSNLSMESPQKVEDSEDDHCCWFLFK